MVGRDDRPLWLRPHEAENEVERQQAEHVFATLRTASDSHEQYSQGLFYGVIAGIVTGTLITLVVIWCVALVYMA
jgi:hypothetical protein